VFAEVLTSAASWQNEQPLLTYAVPPEMQADIRPGQLIAIPYGERLVEGIVWHITEQPDLDDDTRAIRPISIILDSEPALLPHQRALAEWMATYYVAPLAQVAQTMLPPGLMQRSKVVLRLIESEDGRESTSARNGASSEDNEKSENGKYSKVDKGEQDFSTTSALIGLLLADGELDIERLKAMLGPRRARVVLEEALASGVIAREAQLDAPDAHPRRKRLVRLMARGEELEAWKARAQAIIQENLPDPTALPVAPDNVRRRPTKGMPDPWAIPGATSAFTLTRENRAGLLAQRQLAAIDLLEHDKADASAEAHWTPNMLCKASGLTPAQLQSLVRERLVTIDELEVQRDPLAGRNIPPSAPLPLTGEQHAALDAIISTANMDAVGPRPVPPDTHKGYPYISDVPSAPRGGGAVEHVGIPLVGIRGAVAGVDGMAGVGGMAGVDGMDGMAGVGGMAGVAGVDGMDGMDGMDGVNGTDGHTDESFRPILLHGVTGSGKTEVYLQALAAVIARGKRGIVLVPEIALTAQAIYRFAGRFLGRVAVIHSALSDGERYDEWRRIRAGKVDVVIGSRSALFAPVPDLGLLILDEEHEPAYKQSERRPTYLARDAAIALGRLLRIPVVLGSATPSVETFYHAQRGDYRLIEMHHRIGATLPPVEVIDLRDELHAGNTSIISRRLQSELESVLSRGQQAILYLNRRGAASCVLCRECGFVAMCDRCDVPLTYHSTERILLCHYCNGQSKLLRTCPQCGSDSIRYFGLGTEKVVETIERAFPSARLLRWDRDTAKSRRAHEQLLDRFAGREADILVGTQMIAKGLDLPGVTLVGVISADIALMLPDFSASERAFTLLTQVAGRAGRGEEAGQVIIQTFNPQHFCIDAASRHDYHEFYAAEIEARRRYGYPPFRQFVKFTYSHENRRRSQNEALLLREKLDGWIARLGLEQTDIVGPAPALMERLNGKYRWQMIARGPDIHPLLRVLDTPGWDVDIDPVSAM
jgi:primosomal protein N'